MPPNTAVNLFKPGGVTAPTNNNAQTINWVQVGATIDPTAGQTSYPNHGGMSFAELLQAGTNRGLHPTLTELLGTKSGTYGMPMETPIAIKMPGQPDSAAQVIYKNDVGSGQAGNAHYKIDLHPGIASKLGWKPNGDVLVANYDEAKGKITSAATQGGAIQSAAGAIGGLANSVGDALSSISHILGFIFSRQFLYIAAGIPIVLIALAMIYKSQGGPTPKHIPVPV